MSQNPTATLAFAAVLAIAGLGSAHAQENAPTCNPNSGRTRARIECLTRISNALSQKVDSLQAKLAQDTNAANTSDYVRKSDLDDHLQGYVKYNSPLEINMVGDSSTGQSNGSCLAADVDLESVVIDKPCNVTARPELKWQLLSIPKASAQNR